MADRISAATRSLVMSRIRGKNTTPERYLFAAAAGAGWRFEKHAADIPGKPDLVFRRAKIAVFVDGDFWHGYRFPAWSTCIPPRWREKIAATRLRDQRTRRRLRASGWKVIRIWEHEVETDVLRCLDRTALPGSIPFTLAR